MMEVGWVGRISQADEMEGLVTFHCLIGWRASQLAYMLQVIFLCSKYYVTKSHLIKEFPYFLPIFLLLVCTLYTLPTLETTKFITLGGHQGTSLQQALVRGPRCPELTPT